MTEPTHLPKKLEDSLQPGPRDGQLLDGEDVESDPVRIGQCAERPTEQDETGYPRAEHGPQLGGPPELAVIIEMLGDQLTNMIQPFWAIPLLAIANFRARDIIGYTTVAMVAAYLIVGATLTVFFGL